MSSKWIAILEDFGFRVPVNECCWCTTAPDELAGEVKIRDEVVERRGRQTGFKALGCVITFNNRFNEELVNRENRFWRSFYAYKHVFFNKLISTRKRMDMLSNLAKASLFCYASSWNLTTTNLSRLRAIQDKALRRILNFPRKQDENAGAYMERVRHVIKDLKQRYEFMDFPDIYHGMYFEWAGHLARIPQYDATRIATQVTYWKDMTSIKRFEASAGNQGHRRVLRTWRWERPVFKFFKEKKKQIWQVAAQSRREWSEQKKKNSSNGEEAVVESACP